jgi:elongation factor G
VTAPLERVRSIGILAHVDGGKTTLTEMILHAAGETTRAGDVDDGDTVTDWMDQERERGITIVSATVTFGWERQAVDDDRFPVFFFFFFFFFLCPSALGTHFYLSHTHKQTHANTHTRTRVYTYHFILFSSSAKQYTMQLIDTPGHVDFSVEVERSLRALDGAVLVMDAEAGCQAQTEAVWRRARRHRVPIVVVVNKMDKREASVARSEADLESRLGTVPLVVQAPLFAVAAGGGDSGDSGAVIDPALGHPAPGSLRTGVSEDANRFAGCVDLVAMECEVWSGIVRDDPGGATTTSFPASEATLGAELYAEILAARERLVERVADVDDTAAETVLGSDAAIALSIGAEELRAAVRRATLACAASPVMCISALRCVGIEPVLDGIVDYLPSPADVGDTEATFAPVVAATSVPSTSLSSSLSSSSLSSSTTTSPATLGGAFALGGGKGDFNDAAGAATDTDAAAAEDRETIQISPDRDGPLAALVFKVQHRPSMGLIAFLRVYSGTLRARDNIVCSRTGVAERVGRVVVMRANDAEVP